MEQRAKCCLCGRTRFTDKLFRSREKQGIGRFSPSRVKWTCVDKKDCDIHVRIINIKNETRP